MFVIICFIFFYLLCCKPDKTKSMIVYIFGSVAGCVCILYNQHEHEHTVASKYSCCTVTKFQRCFSLLSPVFAVCVVCVWSYGAQSNSLITFDFQLFKHITMTRQTLNPNCITLIVCRSCRVTDESTKTHTCEYTQSLTLPNSYLHPIQCFDNTLICFNV